MLSIKNQPVLSGNVKATLRKLSADGILDVVSPLFVKRPEKRVADRTGHMGYTFLHFQEGSEMPWIECTIMDERMRFVAGLLEGGESMPHAGSQLSP